MSFPKSFERYYLPVVLLVVVLMALYPISRFDVNEWDEARNGVNAFEMLHNGDYVNLYYGGKPDTWNAKPPLFTWCIMLCYKIFGYNAFALRIPALLFTLCYFTYCYKLVSILDNRRTAFLCCMVLVSCKAILGLHVGVTGDFDALLIFLLTASAYYFVRYVEYDKRYALLLTGIFTALAFYAKGPAAFLYAPGFALYLFYRKKWKQVLGDKYTWIALVLIIATVGSWVMLQTVYGNTTTPEGTRYGSKNALEVLFWHDIVKRFTSMEFDQDKYTRDYLFFISRVDILFNVWNYFFYLAAGTGITLLYKNRKRLRHFLQNRTAAAFIFCISMAAPLCIFLTVSMNQHDWYLAPVWIFISFITVRALLYLAKKWQPLAYITIACWTFLAVRHCIYLYTLPAALQPVFTANRPVLQDCDTIVYHGIPAQHIFLYTQWQNKPMQRIDDIQQAYAHTGQLLLAEAKTIKNDPSGLLQTVFPINEQYGIARIK